MSVILITAVYILEEDIRRIANSLKGILDKLEDLRRY